MTLIAVTNLLAFKNGWDSALVVAGTDSRGTGMICATGMAKWSQRALNTARKVRSFIRRK